MSVNYINMKRFLPYISSFPIQNPCFDTYIGNYNRKTGTINADPIHYFSKIDYLSSKSVSPTLTNPRIVIVLESPHIHEFDALTNPIGPAQFTTGSLLKNNIDRLLKTSVVWSKISIYDFDVILINAVQYQTSLGNVLSLTNNRNIRDQNWRTCFNHGASKDLKKRIKAINPIAVINLCTKGNINLQLLLDQSLRPFCKGKYEYTWGTHPSTWNFSYSIIY